MIIELVTLKFSDPRPSTGQAQQVAKHEHEKVQRRACPTCHTALPHDLAHCDTESTKPQQKRARYTSGGCFCQLVMVKVHELVVTEGYDMKGEESDNMQLNTITHRYQAYGRCRIVSRLELSINCWPIQDLAPLFQAWSLVVQL
jgi:hypothetical protein